MRALRAALLAVSLAVAAGALQAQVAPDAPRLISPHGSGGLGLHLLRAHTLPGDEESIVATWALPGLPKGMRLRGGVGRGAADRDAFFGGIDLQSPLLRGDPGLPFDLDWQAGVGVGAGEYVLVSVPLGLSGGVAWRSGSFWMSPYVNAGITADMRLGANAPARSIDVNPALDVGLDVSFDAERRFMLRTAASLGDRQAVTLGFALGLGRP